MKSFFSFFEQATDTANQQPQKVSDNLVTTFGRHNPPHAGHKVALDEAHDIAQNENADQRFYTSHSQDKKQNPLPKEKKVHYLKKMFPEHSQKWDTDDNVKTILGAATKAHEDGYKNFHFVGGSDRRQGMEDLLRKYNGKLYDFSNIYSHSAGDDRDVDADDPLASLSASKQRRAAQNDDFDGFMEGLNLNQSFTMDDARQLFEDVQLFGMKNEEYTSDQISYLYREGILYKPGDVVESSIHGLRGEIHRCGANHLIIITEEGVMFKSFIHDVYSI